MKEEPTFGEPPPSPKPTEWYFAINGEINGPVPQGEIKSLFERGVIDKTTHVWREGMSEWQAIYRSDLAYLLMRMYAPSVVKPSLDASINIGKPRSKWFWPRMIVGTIAGLFLVTNLIGIVTSPKLEVVRKGAWRGDDGKIIEITNVGTNQTRIVGVTINNRADCKVFRISWTDDSSPFPAELKIGEKLTVMSSCLIVRANVDTDQGSGTYSF